MEDVQTADERAHVANLAVLGVAQHERRVERGRVPAVSLLDGGRLDDEIDGVVRHARLALVLAGNVRAHGAAEESLKRDHHREVTALTFGQHPPVGALDALGSGGALPEHLAHGEGHRHRPPLDCFESGLRALRCGLLLNRQL